MSPDTLPGDDVRTFSGASLEDLLPRIRAELGPDAEIVARRDGIEGGVGGFFGRRSIEVDARPARPRLDIRADAPAEPTDDAPAFEPLPPAPAAPTPRAADPGAAFAEQLAAYVKVLPPAAAPAHHPVVDERVHVAPAVEPEPEPAPVVPAAEVAPAAPEPVAPAAAVPAPVVPAASAEDVDDADALVAPSLPAVVTPAAAPAAPVALDADATALVATGVSPALATDLAQTAATHIAPFADDPSPRATMRAALAARIPVATPVRGPGGAVIGFVGPAGSGKTRCVARLASAYAKRSPLPVACVTLRSTDEGAELSALLAESGVPVHAESDAVAAAGRIAALRAETIVIVDTPGVSPRAEASLRTLAGELRRLAADELHLTVPATIGPLAARELERAGRALGADAIALTHADETAALGTVVELAIDTELPLSYVARGTALDGGMRPATADALALALLPSLDPADELV